MEPMARERRRESGAVRITTAAEKRSEEISARQRRYLVSMSIRTVCFIGAAISGAAGIVWLWPLLIAAAVVLPYVAVVEANIAETRSDAFDLPDTGYRRELGGAPGTDRNEDA